jgi:hypothetical protein
MSFNSYYTAPYGAGSKIPTTTIMYACRAPNCDDYKAITTTTLCELTSEEERKLAEVYERIGNTRLYEDPAVFDCYEIKCEKYSPDGNEKKNSKYAPVIGEKEGKFGCNSFAVLPIIIELFGSVFKIVK